MVEPGAGSDLNAPRRESGLDEARPRRLRMLTSGVRTPLSSEEGLREQLVGRRQELAAIDAFLEALPGGGSALVFAGDAGMGKTTLWEDAVAKARSRGLGVAVTRAAAAESSLSFAGLSDLVAGIGDAELAALPVPQRAALEQVLLRRPAAGPVELFAVSLATAGVFRTVAARAPLLIGIDDVQWLDAATAGVLSFALRRLAEEPIGVVASERLGEAEPPLDLERTFAGLRRILVGALGVEEIGQIVGMRLQRRVPPPAARAFHAASSGNPYFAVELADAVGADAELSAEGRLVVPGGLRELLARRLGGLSAEGRRAVVAVAAAGHPARDVIAAVSPSGLAEALASDVLRVVDGRLLPRHPLLATIAYEEAAPAERTAVHGLLAEVGVEEERPLHLALATDAPDFNVAERLEAAVAAAAARGAAHDAGVLAAHAARLTPEEAQAERLRRGLIACDLLEESGDLERARAVANALLRPRPPDPDAAKVLMRLGSVADDRLEGIRLLGEALELAGDDETAAAIHFRLAGAVGIAEGFAVWAGHCRAAAALAERADPALLAMALAATGCAEFWLGKGIDRELMARAIALEDSLDERAAAVLEPEALARAAAPVDGRIRGGAPAARGGSIGARSNAAQRRIGQGSCSIWSSSSAGPATSIARTSTQPRCVACTGSSISCRSARHAMPKHWQPRSRATLSERGGSPARGSRSRRPTATRSSGSRTRWVLGLAELAAGDATAAHQVLAPLPDALDRIGLVETAFAPALALDAEALAGLGRGREADALATRLDQRGRALGRTAARAAAARCRMLAAAAQRRLRGCARSRATGARGPRARQRAVRAGKDAALAGNGPPSRRSEAPGAGNARRGAPRVRGARRDGLGRAGRGGDPPHRRSRRRLGGAERDGAADRPTGRRGADEPRDRRRSRGQRQDGRGEPDEGLPQAGRALADRARPPARPANVGISPIDRPAPDTQSRSR